MKKIVFVRASFDRMSQYGIRFNLYRPIRIMVHRDTFNEESKVNQDCLGFALLRSVIGPEKSANVSTNQI